MSMISSLTIQSHPEAVRISRQCPDVCDPLQLDGAGHGEWQGGTSQDVGCGGREGFRDDPQDLSRCEGPELDVDGVDGDVVPRINRPNFTGDRWLTVGFTYPMRGPACGTLQATDDEGLVGFLLGK